MLTPGFEFTDFATADVQVHAWGDTLETVFSQTVYALMKIMVENPSSIGTAVTKTIKKTAPDKQVLLVDFLTEFLALFDIEQLLVSKVLIQSIKFDPKKGEYTLVAKVWGENYIPEKHTIGSEVKAITFSYLKIEEKKEKTEIYVIYDM
jgi:SHS2 domain-containing protein